MGKKYEEMTNEELGEKANEILEKFREDIYGNSGTTIYLKNISDLQEVINAMKNYGINLTKEKVDKILSGFSDRNREYSISGCIRNYVSGSVFSSFLIPIDRKTETNAKKFSFRSGMSDIENVNSISIPYDEVLNCYEERDEYNQQMVYVILKNDMRIDFECVGIRI